MGIAFGAAVFLVLVLFAGPNERLPWPMQQAGWRGLARSLAVFGAFFVVIHLDGRWFHAQKIRPHDTGVEIGVVILAVVLTTWWPGWGRGLRRM